jgi:hypothetical protein
MALALKELLEGQRPGVLLIPSSVNQGNCSLLTLLGSALKVEMTA